MSANTQTHIPGAWQGQTPSLESERLILRPLNIDDAACIFTRWANDPEVTRYLSWSTHQTIDETIAWLETEEAAGDSPYNYTFGIVEKTSGDLIGSCGITYDEGLDRYGIGYALAKPYWGKGYATEASSQLLDFAINKLGINRFFLYHAKDNPASGKVAQKLGFTFEKDSIFTSDDGSKTFPRKEHHLDIEFDNSSAP